MQDEQKTKSQLISELQALRQEAARLESSLYECKQAEEALQKDHKASEMEQRESKKQLTTLLNAITGIAGLADKDGTILAANNALAKSLGRKKDELIDHSMFEFVASEAAEKRKASLQKIVTSKKPLLWEDCRAGRYFKTSAYPIFDDNGNVKQVAWFAEEITERKKIENKLLQRENYLSALNRAKSVLLSSESENAYQQFIDILGPASNASRTYIFINHTNAKGEALMSQKAEYCAEVIKPEIDNPDLQNLSYNSFEKMNKILSSGNNYSGIVNNFPQDEKEFLEVQGIKAILMIPIISENDFIGFIGFDNCVSEREWDSVEQEFLQAAAHDLAVFIERNRSKKQLKTEHIRFQTAMDAMDAIVYVADMQTYKLIFSNKIFKNLFGNKIGEKCYFVMQKGQTKPCNFCTNHLLLDKNGNPKEPYVWEFQNTITKQWYQLRDQAIYWPDGKLVRIEIGTDITDRKKAEQALKKSERKFRGLFTGMSAGVVFCKAVYDENGNMTDSILKDMNPVYEKLANLKKETAIGRKVSEMLRGIGLEWFSTFDEVLKTGNSASFEMYHENSKKYYSIFAYYSEKDEFVAIFDDITIQKKAILALKESKNRFKALSEATYESILISDKGICIEANQAASKMFGYSYNELIGIFGTDVIAGESKELVKKNMLAGYEKPYDAIAQRKDGSKFNVEILGRMFEYKGKNVRITAVKDITERKVTELKLQKYAKTQETLTREVNHRVKNNLSAIISMLHKEQDRAEAQELSSLPVLDALEKRIRCLASVHSLLSESRWRPIKLDELCKLIISGALYNLPLSWNANLNVNASTVRVNSGQAHHLALVLNELATNTIKHALANRETVQINVDIKQRKNDVRICFCDDGPGYPQEMTDGDFINSGVGFELIQGIVRHSLSGNVRIENDNGAKTVISIQSAVFSRQSSVGSRQSTAYSSSTATVDCGLKTADC
ncbi:PAS domain S-box protein [Desulfococcaceae bacterium HSG9]|nr:PAS domain S-box protein [Desulfococcaceae bacterium HSG9]